MERLRYLDGKLTRRYQDQRLRQRAVAGAGEPLQDREGESGRLARSRRGLPEQVQPREQRRDRLALDRRRLLVAEVAERAQQFRAQRQLGEGGRIVGGVRRVGR